MAIRERAITAIKKEQRKRKLKRYVLTSSLMLVNILIYTGVLALVFHLPIFRINASVVQGVDGAREAEVSAKVGALLGQKIFFVFPKYITIFSPASMSASLENAIPWIESSGAKIDAHTMQIEVTERKPAYIVCDANGACFYADINTLVFAPAPDFSAPVYPELKIPHVATSSLMMKNVFSKDTAGKLQELARKFAEHKIVLSSFEETKEGSYIIYTNEGWYIRMTNDEPVSAVIDSMRAVLKSEKFARAYARIPHRLEYIDVRLIDKVFYKFSGSESNATTTPADN